MITRTTDYDRAADISFFARNGVFGLNDGSVIKGPISNVESEYDDPNGIGCIDVIVDEDRGVLDCVYPNTFAWAEFDGLEANDLPERLRDGE